MAVKRRTFTAMSTSAASASATCARTSPVAGFTVANLQNEGGVVIVPQVAEQTLYCEISRHPPQISAVAYANKANYMKAAVARCTQECMDPNVWTRNGIVPFASIGITYVFLLTLSTNSPACAQ
jgi:hypothetical protein